MSEFALLRAFLSAQKSTQGPTEPLCNFVQVSGVDIPGWDGKLAVERENKWKRECNREREGKFSAIEHGKCLERKRTEWANYLQTEDGKNCIKEAVGDIDKTLACGASSVTFNVFLGAILATVLLVRSEKVR